MRILLVDADAAESAQLDRSLRCRRAEWEVVRAGSLLEAIRVAGEGAFDAAVLDADMPEGSGLDILDYLRIGSPGIRIVLLCARPDERVAFHALSHGAGDLLAKDKHLERELPLRLDALLDAPGAAHALVETLAPVGTYDARGAKPHDAEGTGGLEDTLRGLVGAGVRAAGVWDLHGRPLATSDEDALDAEGIGFALATLHGQLGALHAHADMTPTGYRFVIETEEGLLAVTAVPGTYILGLLMDAATAPRRALERADQAALKVLATLQRGVSGDDVPAA